MRTCHVQIVCSILNNGFMYVLNEQLNLRTDNIDFIVTYIIKRIYIIDTKQSIYFDNLSPC